MHFQLMPVFLLAGIAAAATPEVRGVWVDRSVMGSREKIREVMRTLADGNLNAAFVNVWSRGYPLWPSRTFESETGMVIDPGYTGRDPLQEAIEEGQKVGVAVIPWVEYGFVGGWSGYHPGQGGKGPIFDRHPEWLAQARNGSTSFPIQAGGSYFWMIHTHPDVQEFLFRMMEELARDYDVPALQFDRARYPSLDCGYDDYTRNLYREETGREAPDSPGDAQWLRWRADKLNEFIGTLNRRIKEADWRMLTTNAPVVYRLSYVDYAQDYPAWVRQGAVDFISPQIYRNDTAAFGRELDNQLREMPRGARLVPGVNVVADAEVVVATIEDVRRRKLPGVVLWYYGSLLQTGALRRLKETVYSEPAALPWRSAKAGANAE